MSPILAARSSSRYSMTARLTWPHSRSPHENAKEPKKYLTPDWRKIKNSDAPAVKRKVVLPFQLLFFGRALGRKRIEKH
jgi:hypothetical protein